MAPKKCCILNIPVDKIHYIVISWFLQNGPTISWGVVRHPLGSSRARAKACEFRLLERSDWNPDGRCGAITIKCRPKFGAQRRNK
jgi:hypothetical protein